MKPRKLFSLLAALCVSASLPAQIPCDDDSGISSDFSQFASKLRQAVAHRDVAALRNLSGDSISASWGDEPTESLFSSYFGDPKSEWVWEQMEKALHAGFWNITDSSWTSGYGCDSVFTSPAFLKQMPGYNEIVIIGDHVPVLKKPGSSGAEIDRVSCMLVPLRESHQLTRFYDNKTKWVPVYLSGGRPGYVHEKYTSLSVQFEVMAGRVNGEWKLIAIFEPMGC